MYRTFILRDHRSELSALAAGAKQAEVSSPAPRAAALKVSVEEQSHHTLIAMGPPQFSGSTRKKNNPVHIVSSRPARATWRDPVLKTKYKTKIKHPQTQQDGQENCCFLSSPANRCLPHLALRPVSVTVNPLRGPSAMGHPSPTPAPSAQKHSCPSAEPMN